MFSRADQLRVMQLENDFRLHAISYGWDDFEPELLINDLDEGQLIPFIFERHFGFSISRKRRCIGSFIDGKYVPCRTGASVKRFSQCPECAEEFIAVQECLFEPKCDGTLCDSPICRKEHCVYIAFFGAKPKVGMTLKSRVRRRLIEQGADAYFVADVFPNRICARKAEQEISKRMRITERPSSITVLKSLQIPSKRRNIEEIWSGLSDSIEGRMGLKTDKLNFLDDYPLEEPLGSVPRLAESWGMHSGRLIGIKGKFLVYESDRIQALNLFDVPARFLSKDSI
ncbi:MAG TPA: DUF2797 domain-containing protein [Euryarchaeota archaeon]|nr:DUF2797 domain-containing protein [Euryarchaeota archaeon]